MGPRHRGAQPRAGPSRHRREQQCRPAPCGLSVGQLGGPALGPQLGSPPCGHIWGLSTCDSGLGLFPGHSPRPGSQNGPPRAMPGLVLPGPGAQGEGGGGGWPSIQPEGTLAVRGLAVLRRATPRHGPQLSPDRRRHPCLHLVDEETAQTSPPTGSSLVVTDQLLSSLARCWPPLRPDSTAQLRCPGYKRGGLAGG